MAGSSLPLAVLMCRRVVVVVVVLPTACALGNSPLPLSLRLLGFSSSSGHTCALLWQEEMWKIRR